MGVGKGNVEVVNIDHLFLIFIYEYATRGRHCCSYPNITTQDRLRLSTRSPCYPSFFSPIPVTALLVLQGLITPDLYWCATGEATLLFGRGEGGPSEQWEGGSTKVCQRGTRVVCVSSRQYSSSMQGRPITSTGEYKATTQQVSPCLVQDDLMFSLYYIK